MEPNLAILRGTSGSRRSRRPDASVCGRQLSLVRKRRSRTLLLSLSLWFVGCTEHEHWVLSRARYACGGCGLEWGMRRCAAARCIYGHGWGAGRASAVQWARGAKPDFPMAAAGAASACAGRPWLRPLRSWHALCPALLSFSFILQTKQSYLTANMPD